VAKKPEAPPSTKKALAERNTANEFKMMLAAANKGEEPALEKVRTWLQDSSGVDLLGGNLASLAETSLIAAAAGEDRVFKMAVQRKLQMMRADLSGPNPTPLERLLAERVALCWVFAHYEDVRCAQGQKGMTFAQSEYYQRRQDRAHKRYLSAMRTLAAVRKLGLPVVQVNIARKQVNVGQAQVIATGAGRSDKGGLPCE